MTGAPRAASRRAGGPEHRHRVGLSSHLPVATRPAIVRRGGLLGAARREPRTPASRREEGGVLRVCPRSRRRLLVVVSPLDRPTL